LERIIPLNGGWGTLKGVERKSWEVRRRSREERRR